MTTRPARPWRLGLIVSLSVSFLNVQDFVCMRVRGMYRACAAACVSLTVRQLDPENPSQGPRHCDPVLRRRNSAHSPQGRARARLCM